MKQHLYLDPIAVGTRIYTARKALNMSRMSLAKKMGYQTEQSVGRWERGEVTPRIDILADLCSTLHVSIDYLLTGLPSVA